jgi:hypothetical protein
MPRKPPPKKAPARDLPDTPRSLQVGDHVIPQGSSSIYEITCVSLEGATVELCLRGTNLERCISF